MKQYKIKLLFMDSETTLDLRRVVAITSPKSGSFVIYFENGVWNVVESEYEHVYNAWMAL